MASAVWRVAFPSRSMVAKCTSNIPSRALQARFLHPLAPAFLRSPAGGAPGRGVAMLDDGRSPRMNATLSKFMCAMVLKLRAMGSSFFFASAASFFFFCSSIIASIGSSGGASGSGFLGRGMVWWWW